ncbi:MAG: hypothetical protein AVDCRST_MAG65-2277, partial [uncultured Solirubrobacteraceae bacterium]
GRLGGPLGQRLGGAHHGGGHDRLVGRDEHEGGDAHLAGHARHHARRDRVVADRLAGIGLHQADVLV